VREKSKALFGNRDRAEVAQAIAQSPDGIVNATDLSLELGMLNSRVRTQLLALVEAELLDPGLQEAGKRWYVRRESSFWTTLSDLIDAWIR
jgi:hypothetical protein